MVAASLAAEAGDALAAQRRRLPMVEVDSATNLIGADGPVPGVGARTPWVTLLLVVGLVVAICLRKWWVAVAVVAAVALKLLTVDLANDPSSRDRFQRESRLARTLRRDLWSRASWWERTERLFSPALVSVDRGTFEGPLRFAYQLRERIEFQAYSRGYTGPFASLDAAGKIASWFFVNINSGPSSIETPYKVAKAKSEFVQSDAPLRHGSYRGLAATANTFARECFMDELAQAAGQDELEFRRKRQLARGLPRGV